MESSFPCSEPSGWSPPDWFEPHLIPDGRFAKAYNALTDDRRALLKGLIARHYVLNAPPSAVSTVATDSFALFTRRSVREPMPFVLLLTDRDLDAPALFLAALMPALCARVPQVLVCRVGKKSDVPDSLLVCCELSGQERVAAVGSVLLKRLLTDCAESTAASGESGIVLYPDTQAFRHLLSQPALRAALDSSALRLTPLRPPRACGLWRDECHQFPPLDVALLYGLLNFDIGGVAPGAHKTVPDESAWKIFRNVPRDLDLLPQARAGRGRGGVTVTESCLGQWAWPELIPGFFVQQRQIFLPAL
jgi:hypothetical protein